MQVSTWSILKVFLILIGIGLLWFLRDVVAMLFVALLLAALIDPFADFLAERNIPRGLAVLVIYACLLLIVTLVFFLIIPPLTIQITQLVQSFGFQGQLSDLVETLRRITVGLGDTLDTSRIFSVVQGFSQTLTGFVGTVSATVIVLVLTFYMVVEEEAAMRLFRSLAPQEYQPYLSQLFNRMREKIGAWLRGQIILGVIIGVLTFIGLSIIDMRYALVLALIAGMLEIIPYIGPIFAGVPAVVLAFLESPTKGIAVLVLYIIIQQVENHVLVPRVMQKVAGLNPVVSIAALLVGFKLGGIVGAIFAIPVATMATVILEDLFYGYQKPDDAYVP